MLFDGAKIMENEEIFLPQGAVLQNRYEIISVLGTGGFGITYRAVDHLLNCYVAVKEFFPKKWAVRNAEKTWKVQFPEDEESRCIVEECRQNFHHEAKILEEIRDVPYIARRKDYFKENETEYIVLTLIQGETLSAYAKRRGGTLPAGEVLSLLSYTFDTLKYLHAMGIIHRDICPGNLMLSEDGVIFLIDFGSATSYGERGDLHSGQVFEHKGFEAPESSQREKQGPWTDIFSLCAMMVYLITGEGIAEAKSGRYMEELPPLLTGTALSARQQNALLHGMNPEISYRPHDVEQLHLELYGEPLTAESLPEKWVVFYQAGTCIGSRKINQDNFMVDTAFCYMGKDCQQTGALLCQPKEMHVATVCDGVGGANYGELASKAAVQAVIHFVEQQPERDVLPDRLLEDLLDQINEKILTLCEKIGQTATTLSLLLWQGDRYYAVNIGDSPIFRLRRGKLKRISTPQTRADLNIMIQRPVQKEDFNTLTDFLGKKGVSGSQMAAFHYGKLQKGDTFLVCSDGVSKRIDENRLKHFLSKRGNRCISSMFKSIARSKENDNYTAIILKF